MSWTSGAPSRAASSMTLIQSAVPILPCVPSGPEPALPGVQRSWQRPGTSSATNGGLSGVAGCAVAGSASVDPKKVQGWLGGRVPHPRHRMALVRLLGEEEGYLWPSARPDVGPGAEATSEVVAAYGHRVDVPRQKWTSLLATARQHIDLLGYAFLFLPEQHVELTSAIERKCRDGCQVRIMVADPGGRHVIERDDLERLGGNLPPGERPPLHPPQPLNGPPWGRLDDLRSER